MSGHEHRTVIRTNILGTSTIESWNGDKVLSWLIEGKPHDIEEQHRSQVLNALCALIFPDAEKRAELYQRLSRVIANIDYLRGGPDKLAADNALEKLGYKDLHKICLDSLRE